MSVWLVLGPLVARPWGFANLWFSDIGCGYGGMPFEYVGPVDVCVIYRAAPIVEWALGVLAVLLTPAALVWVTRLFIRAVRSNLPVWFPSLVCTLLLGLTGALYQHATAYYNCGEIMPVGPTGLGIDPRDVRGVRARETCLWEHYREGKRVMLTAYFGGSDTGVTHLITVDPADQAAPIHDEITPGGNGIEAKPVSFAVGSPTWACTGWCTRSSHFRHTNPAVRS
jgi:hypothetical protein